MLGVLPATGGLTRVVDKRKVRRDRADVFCTLEEGVKGQRALKWGLVDELVPRSRFEDVVRQRALELAARSDRPTGVAGITLQRLQKEITDASVTYASVFVDLDRDLRVARLKISAPTDPPPATPAKLGDLGDRFWPLAVARELEDALLHLRVNESRLGLLLITTEGDPDLVTEYDSFLLAHSDDWLVREINLYWRRTLKRLDVTSQTLFALIEPGSCFVGFLGELIFAVDRSYMFEGEREDSDLPPPMVRISGSNFGLLPMANGLTRLQTRFLGDPASLQNARSLIGRKLEAPAAAEAGLVTSILDEIDWDDEVRIDIEERASFSADALTGMEANLRFSGPETLETKIFGRLSAWQNWIFQRPNAVGEEGALRRYGTGIRPKFNQQRI